MGDPPSYVVNGPLVPGPGSVLSYWISGSVDTYAHLPAIPVGQGVGQAWLVNSESMVYVWSGTAWPAQGLGLAILGSGGATVATGIGYTAAGDGAVATTVQAALARQKWVEDFLAAGFNPTTDDATSAIAAAVTALAAVGGGVLNFTRGYLFNYVLDTPNIIFRGVAGLSNSNPSLITSWHRAFDPAQYCLQLGGGTTLRRGIGVVGMAFDGRGSAQFGVKICGVYNFIWRQSTVVGFTNKNLYITSTTTGVPTSEMSFSDFCFASPTTGTAEVVTIEYGAEYTTGVFFNNGTMSSAAGAVLSLNGVNIDIVNAYISVNGAGGGINFLTSDAYIVGHNIHLDASAHAATYSVALFPTTSVDSAHLVESYLRGFFNINGLLQFSDAVTLDPFGSCYRLPFRSLMSYPIALGNMTFLRALPTANDSSANPNLQPQISAGTTSWNFDANAAVDITFTPGTGKAFKVAGRFNAPSGLTASRPASPATGDHYFDTTLGKPIWRNGSNWVDATGATV